MKLRVCVSVDSPLLCYLYHTHCHTAYVKAVLVCMCYGKANMGYTRFHSGDPWMPSAATENLHWL